MKYLKWIGSRPRQLGSASNYVSHATNKKVNPSTPQLDSQNIDNLISCKPSSLSALASVSKSVFKFKLRRNGPS